jgi:ribosomal protein S18 acetylase RimI-like enzyme
MIMAEYDVRVAKESERETVLNTLTLAFATDPCVRYMMPRADAFLAGYPRLAFAMGGAGLAHGSAWLADDGAAAALWLPPGVESDREALNAVIGEFAPGDRLETLGQVGEGLGRYHPQEPHWYLAMIGVDPSRQGLGLGSALLKAALARCDAEHAVAYLESSNLKNVPLYERHGFEVMGLVQPNDFPPLVPMLRPAR